VVTTIETAGCLTAPTEPGPVIKWPRYYTRTASHEKIFGFKLTAVLPISMRPNRRNSESVPAWAKKEPPDDGFPVSPEIVDTARETLLISHQRG
jgi:hypothetical protein